MNSYSVGFCRTALPPSAFFLFFLRFFLRSSMQVHSSGLFPNRGAPFLEVPSLSCGLYRPAHNFLFVRRALMTLLPESSLSFLQVQSDAEIRTHIFFRRPRYALFPSAQAVTAF